MNKHQLLARLESAWAAFTASYAGLTDAQLTQAGVTGQWSVKDLLAHVTIWENEALKSLPLVLRGERLPRYSVLYGGIDAFNAQMVEGKRGLSLAAIQQEQAQTHRRLLDYIQSAPEDQFARETRFRRRLRLDTYSHYPIHTQAILEWRKRQG